MARIKEPRVKMPEQEPQRRINDFEEVNLGLSMELAQQEARRCLQCKKPMCMEGCPVRVNIPGFIGAVAKGDFTEAAKIVHVCTQNDLHDQLS